MPKVFIPQVPSRFDRATQMWVPVVNLQSAERFGQLVTLLPPEANRMHIAPLVAAMKEKLTEVSPDDWLLAVGDPSLIGAACVLFARKCNYQLRVLRWDKFTSSYFPVEIQL